MSLSQNISQQSVNLTRASVSPSIIDEAYAYCREIARKHYENFPVASFFLPSQVRPYVAAIYAFARTADDFADEGDVLSDQRLAALEDWHRQLLACTQGRADNPIFVALADVIRRKRIPIQLLEDLLFAFKMDVTTTRFKTYQDLSFYCKHSANPIGRLVLYLFDEATENNFALSDKICTALQLTNFWQDVAVDWRKGRIYLPLEDLIRFGYTEHDLSQNCCNENLRSLLKFEIERTRGLFEAGKGLLSEVSGRLGFELRLTWNGGMSILRKIEANPDVFHFRPTLTFADKFSIILKSMVSRS